MTSIERQISPEPRERLRPGEVLLFPKPGFLVDTILWEGYLAIYSRYLNASDPHPNEETLARHIPQIIEHIQREGFKEFFEQEPLVLQEYDGVLTALEHAVGPENMYVLTDLARWGRDWENPFNLDKRAAQYNSKVEDFQSMAFLTNEAFQCFPRDMFVQFGQYVFVNPRAFPRFRETEYYKKSLLGEGGMSVVAQNAVIFCENLQNANTERDVRLIEQLGYKVAFVPPVQPDRQLPNRRKISENHVDGHCALITGKNKKLYFLFSTSYAQQDPRTYDALVAAADNVGAEPCVVEDGVYLGFNFIQLPDGSVVYPRTGTWVSEKYRVSALDAVLLKLVGLENMIITDILIHIPRHNHGGLRCMTNIAPESFVAHLARAGA